MSTKPDVRDSIIDQAQQARITKDTLILQKVNRAHRDAFEVKFPTQAAHIMRLTAERLQAVLLNKPADLANPETWAATAQEIRDLSQALYYLAQIRQIYPIEE